jgi:hypothetical protein
VARSGRALDARRLFSRYHPFHINHFSASGIVHGLAEFSGNPGFLVFDHETYYLNPLLLRESPYLLDYFYGTHPLNNKPGWPLMPSQLCLLCFELLRVIPALPRSIHQCAQHGASCSGRCRPPPQFPDRLDPGLSRIQDSGFRIQDSGFRNELRSAQFCEKAN